MNSLSIQLKTLLSGLPDFVVIIIFTILIVNVVMWFFLPFAIYGIQGKMNKSRKIQEQILKALETLSVRAQTSKPVRSEPILQQQKEPYIDNHYPYSFEHKGFTIQHNNKDFFVGKRKFASADEARAFIDK